MKRILRAVPFVVLFTVTSRLAIATVAIPTVPVGNAGNPADSTGFGAVSNEYQIGKYEVTNAQYVEFLNSVAVTDDYGLYNPFMSSEAQGGIIQSGSSGSFSYSAKAGQANMPVVFVSFWDAARFVNWLHNGQPTGLQTSATTEDGAYTLNGYTGSDGSSIARNAGAKWFLPTADEWYKAAYHKNNGATADYWSYPTASNTRPYSDQPPGTDAPDPSNTANIWKDDGVVNGFDDGYAASGSPLSNIYTELLLTPVGEYSSAASSYRTFDQGGNASEWTESILTASYREMRGGSYSDGFSDYLISSQNAGSLPFDENNSAFGFRVATVPEPSLALMIAVTFSFAATCRLSRMCVRQGQSITR